MGKINWVRVILGGLLAGLIINIGEYVLNELIIKKDWEAAMEALNQPPATGAAAMAGFVITAFLMGIGMIWLYAAIRPRYGAGPKTAVCAGLAAWFFLYFLGFGSSFIMGLFPAKLMLIAEVWGLFELPIAAVIGAWPYKEE